MKYKKSLFWKIEANVLNESKKYTSRTEFYKKAHGAYIAAKEQGLLDKMTWLTRQNVYKDPIDTVYRYYFVNENAIYVGRTIHLETRDREHRTRENDTVNEFSRENKTEIPKIEVIESGLTIIQGADRERYWAEYYKDNGFNLINKQPCGSIGYMSRGKWSKEKCFEEARKYKTRSEFQRNASHAFATAMKKGWINEMDWFPIPKSHPNGYWTKERIIEAAKEYTTKKEFIKNNYAAYYAALKHDVIDELTWLEGKKKLPFGYWKDKEHCIEEAKKYKSKTEFQKNNQSAYWASLKYGYLEEMPWLIKNKNIRL